MPSKFGGIPIEQEPQPQSRFGGIPVSEKMPSKFGGIPIEQEPQPQSRFGGIPVSDYASDDSGDKEPIHPPSPWAEKEQTFREKMSEYGKELGHQLGLTARWGAEGIAGAVGTLSDPLGYAMASAMDKQYEPLSQYVSKKLSDLGVPEPKNQAEEIVGEITKSIAGVGAGAGAAGGLSRGVGGLTGQVAKTMAAQPAQQLTGAAGAAAGQQAAEKMGAGPVGQIAASLAGGVAGAGIGGVPRKYAAAELPAQVKEAEERGIQVLTTDIAPPKTRMGETFQRAEKPLRVAQQAQRVEAVKDFAVQYGADELLPGYGEDKAAIDLVYSELKKKRGFKLGKYTDLKRDVIERLDEKGAVPIPKTSAKIDEELTKIRQFDDKSSLIPFYEEFRSKLENKSLVNIEELRKDLGDQLSSNPNLAAIKDRGQKIADKIYKTLNDDMGTFIEKTGEPKDYNKWKASNKKLAQMANELKIGVLKSTLKQGDATPETVNKMLFSKNPSTIRLLYRNLPPQGKRNARTALIQEAIAKAGGIENISPDRFKNQLKLLQKQTGVFFVKEDKQAVEGLYRALKTTETATKIIAGPPTGALNVPLLTSILGGVGAGAGAVGGPYGAVAGAVALPLSVNGASRVYNSRPVRNILLKIPMVVKGSPEEARLVKRLWTTMQDEYDKEEEKK